MTAAWIATRLTAQDSIVHLWPDGALTWALGKHIRGSAHHPRTDEQREVGLRAGWLVMGEVEIYDDDEVPALIAAARWTANRGGTPGDMRARLHRAYLRPVWQTLEADRNGVPKVQVWRLPRLLWPGLAVWRYSGAYSLWDEVGRSGTYRPTGLRFATQRELAAYLSTLKTITPPMSRPAPVTPEDR